MTEPKDLIPVAEARALLVVSRQKMTDLIKQGFIKAYSNPLDKRVKYVSQAEVLKLRETYEEAA
jgi:DNA-binding MarR family transcriptional regulator